MPTGYTAAVVEGKVTDFTEYALGCARAFGALIAMRDDSQDAEIPDVFEPSDHYIQRSEQDRAQLARIKAMSDADCELAAAQDYEKAVDQYRDSLALYTDQDRRIRDMLEKAKAYQPPTPDHEGYANFMVEQLEKTLKYDGLADDRPMEPVRKTGSEWRDVRIECLNRTISSAEELHAEEVELARERTEWVQQMKASLGLELQTA